MLTKTKEFNFMNKNKEKSTKMKILLNLLGKKNNLKFILDKNKENRNKSAININQNNNSNIISDSHINYSSKKKDNNKKNDK